MINLPLNGLQDFIRAITKNEHLSVYQVESTLCVMDDEKGHVLLNMDIPAQDWWKGYGNDEKALATFVTMVGNKLKENGETNETNI